MDSKNLEQYLDQHRWLLNNGLVTEDVKNQLFFCGSIVHKEVQAVELDLTPENKLILYKIYVDKDLLKKIASYHELSKSTGLIGMWRFKRLLQKEGSLDFQQILQKCVTDYCGPNWVAKVEILDMESYVEGFGEAGEANGDGQQSNKLPD